MSDTPPAATGGQEVLLVAYCNGHRCAGLRRPHSAEPAAELLERARKAPGLEPLHRAIRQRPRSLLLAMPCLGHCDQAPMVALGWAVVAGRGAQWTSPPIGVGLIDRPGRVAALGQWISTTAPDLESAPSLWHQQ